MASTDEQNIRDTAVPEIKFDHFSSKMAYDPYDIWHRLRNQCPVAHSGAHGGFYLLSRYDDVYNAATDWETFSSASGVAIPAQPMPNLIPVEVDPPEHRLYRQLLNTRLTPQALARFQPYIRELAGDLLDGLVAKRRFDIVTGFAEPFPRWVVIELLGFPRADEPKLSEWVEILSTARDDPRAAEAGPAFLGYVSDTLAKRRAAPPTDDLTSAVAHGEIDGRPLTELEAQMTMMLLIFGGLHTTTNAIGGMFYWLADHPEDRQRLRDEPDLLGLAVDEFIRFTSGTTYIGRTTTRDVELHGCVIPANEKVMLCYGPANRDPEKFDRPDEVLVDRNPNHHLAFGMGPHRCAGSHLAKMEIRIALEEFFARVTDFEIEDHAKVTWVGGEARGLRAVPVVITD